MKGNRACGLCLIFLLTPSLWLRAEEVEIRHGGLTLNASLDLAGGQWSSGPVVLMTHGSLAHNGTYLMAALQDQLKGRGISTLAINLSLGLNNRHGMYDCLTPHRHKHTDALDEIGGWLEWLKSQGVKKVVLLGVSRGGDQTAWFAAERDDPVVEGLILVDPQTWDPASVSADYQHRYNRALAPLIEQARALVKAGQGNKVFDHVDFLYCPDTRATAETFLSYYDSDPRLDTPTLLPKIRKPVLIVVGTDDDATKVLQQRVAPFTDGKRVRLAVIDGGDEFSRDLYAEELVGHVQTFVDGL
jgi:pimeloyl-ACP methyl ester carboxylesterase